VPGSLPQLRFGRRSDARSGANRARSTVPLVRRNMRPCCAIAMVSMPTTMPTCSSTSSGVRPLRQLTKNDKPLRGMDTHAGAGDSLEHGFATKSAEFQGGIGRIGSRSDLSAPLAEYVDQMSRANLDGPRCATRCSASPAAPAPSGLRKRGAASRRTCPASCGAPPPATGSTSRFASWSPRRGQRRAA